MGFIELFEPLRDVFSVSVPLRGMGFIDDICKHGVILFCFRPLTGHGFHPIPVDKYIFPAGFRPLTGHGFHLFN